MVFMVSLYGIFKVFLYNVSIIYYLMVCKYQYNLCRLLGACSQSVSRSNLNDCCINSLGYTIFCFIFDNFMHYAVYLHFQYFSKSYAMVSSIIRFISFRVITGNIRSEKMKKQLLYCRYWSSKTRYCSIFVL